MLFLGIDTTFHTTGLALVDKENEVYFNKSIKIDFRNQDADIFFNAHIKNLVKLFDSLPDLNKAWNKIGLVSVVNQEGAFHSVPIGVTAACMIGLVKNKKVIGVSHERAHLYSNWLGRNDNQFKFPIVCLSVSGAHSAIYLLKSHKDIKEIITIKWDEINNDFAGISALFEIFCHRMGIKIPTVGMGGVVLSDLAKKGKNISLPELSDIKIKYEKRCIRILGCQSAIEKIRLKHKQRLKNRAFQQNLALGFMNKIFSILSESLLRYALITNSKEMHLAGGVSANQIFCKTARNLAESSGLVFKAPFQNGFCGDNAAMVAVCGKYQNYRKSEKVVKAVPSFWYYRYYFNKYLTRKK